jgi:HTH-type transcriptional regulator, sugar sensing transcriptional regulator
VEDRLTEELVSLGLRANEARAYLALVRHGPVSAAEVADAAGISRPKVYESLKSLERIGFCLPYSDGASRYQAVPPTLAISELLRRREQSRLESEKRDQQTATRVLAELPNEPEASAGGPDGYMTAVVGRDDMLELFRGIASRAEHQLDIVLGSPQIEPPETGMATQLDALRRGVKMRIIYDSNLPDVSESYDELVANGAQIRKLESAPLRLALRDSGGEGLVALVARSGADYHAASVRIIHSELVAPFQILFNRQWRQATAVSLKRARRRGRPTAAHKREPSAT